MKNLFRWIPLHILVALAPLAGFDLTEGLLGHWPFDGSVQDQSAYGNDAMLTNGCGFSQGPLGNYLSPATNGVNAKYASMGNKIPFSTLSNQFSAAFWANFTGSNFQVPVGNVCLVSRKGNAYLFYMDLISANSLRTVLQTTGGALNATGSGTIPKSNWVHFAVTYDGSILTVYTNGVSYATAVGIGNISNEATSTFTVGTRGDNPSNTVMNGGGICGLRLYNRSLSTSEIAILAGGVPTAAVTNVSNGGYMARPTVFHGIHRSAAGISNTRLLILDSQGNEITNMAVDFRCGDAWSASPNLVYGAYKAVVVTTNSNRFGFTSTALDFSVTVFSRLTVRTVDRWGGAWPGGKLLGPSGAGYDGLRTNDERGECVWEHLPIGTRVVLSNFSPQVVGAPLMVTNFEMPGEDLSFIWKLDAPASNGPAYVRSPNAAFLDLNSSTSYRLVLDHLSPASKLVTVAAVRLSGSDRRRLYSSYHPGESITLEIPLEELRWGSPHGPWIMEAAVQESGVDAGRSSIFRQMVFFTR